MIKPMIGLMHIDETLHESFQVGQRVTDIGRPDWNVGIITHIDNNYMVVEYPTIQPISYSFINANIFLELTT